MSPGFSTKLSEDYFWDLKLLVIDWVLCAKQIICESLFIHSFSCSFIHSINTYCIYARGFGAKRNKTRSLPSLTDGRDKRGPRC